MFDAFVTFQARLKPRAVAIVTPRRTATYAQLEADTDRFAFGLRAMGIAPERGVVSIAMDDDYLGHVVFLALARLGVCSSPSYDEAADLRIAERVVPDGAAGGGPPRVHLPPDWVAATLAAEPVPFEAVRGPPETLVRVMLSSGSTRTPRRVAKTWASMRSSAMTGATTFLSGPPGRWVALTGLDSMMGQNMAAAAWMTGSAVVVGETAEGVARKLEALRPSIIGLTPIQLQTLLGWLPADAIAQPSLRIVTGGAVLPKLVARDARLRLSPDVCISYGATETGSISMADAMTLETHLRVVGYPHPEVRVEVVDAEGRALPAGEVGEVRIASERVATGYIDDPQGSAAAFRDGWFYPGDLGRFTPAGLLMIEGRTDERLNLGGGKYLPSAIEDLALSCPAVVDAAAFAVADEQGIDVCWLAVVTDEGFSRDQLANLILAQGEAMPPVRFAWTEAIPRNSGGKIDRPQLRRDTLATLGLPTPD